MGRAKSVIHVDIRIPGKLCGEIVLGLSQLGVFLRRFIFNGLFLVKPQIFEQQTVAGLERLSLGRGVGADTVIRKDDLLA